MSFNRSICLVAAVAGVLVALPATAQTKQEQALERYNEGRKAIAEKQYDTAVAKFLEALALDPNPVLVFNVARAYELKGDRKPALTFYRQYLAMSISKSDRADAESRIKALEASEKAASRGRISIRSVPDGATVTIDGKPVVGSDYSKLAVEPGTHTVEVSKPGHTRFKSSVSVAAGASVNVDVTLAAIATPVVTPKSDPNPKPKTVLPEPTVTKEPSGPGMSGMMIGGIVTVGIGGATLAGAIGHMVYASSEDDKYDPACVEGCFTLDDAKANDTVTAVLYGVAGASIAAGVVLMVLGRNKSEPGTAYRFGVSPHGDGALLNIGGAF